MSNQKLKDKKKRKRTQLVKERVQKRREATRAKSRAEKIVRDIEHKHETKGVSYRKEEDELYKLKSLESQLQRNAKVLQQLEDRYKEEMSTREDVNETLAEEGYSSLEEKMEAIQQQAIKAAEEYAEKEVGKKEIAGFKSSRNGLVADDESSIQSEES